MRITITSLVSLERKSRDAKRNYLASLGAFLWEADDDERDECKVALEKAGADYASDRRVAEWAQEVMMEAGESCPRMWSLAFLNALRALALAIGKSESETFMAGIKAFGQDLSTKHLIDWTPETETESNPMDNIERAIVMLVNECPKVDAMALEAIRARLLAI
jgi:hypothetical protein